MDYCLNSISLKSIWGCEQCYNGFYLTKHEVLPFLGQFPFRNLGLPLSTRRMSIKVCQPLLEKVRRLPSSWTIRKLSYAGRMTLLQSVIIGIIAFGPKSFGYLLVLCNWLNHYAVNSFGLGIEGEENHPHQLKDGWPNGGLSFKELLGQSKALCTKWLWKILSQPSIFIKWVDAYQLKRGISLITEHWMGMLWGWRSLMPLKNDILSKDGGKFKVED